MCQPANPDLTGDGFVGFIVTNWERMPQHIGPFGW